VNVEGTTQRTLITSGFMAKLGFVHEQRISGRDPRPDPRSPAGVGSGRREPA
jgi:hypothetical protein